MTSANISHGDPPAPDEVVPPPDIDEGVPPPGGIEKLKSRYIAFGISTTDTEKFFRDYGYNYLLSKLAFVQEEADAKNPAGFLYKAVTDDFGVPEDVLNSAQRSAGVTNSIADRKEAEYQLRLEHQSKRKQAERDRQDELVAEAARLRSLEPLEAEDDDNYPEEEDEAPVRVEMDEKEMALARKRLMESIEADQYPEDDNDPVEEEYAPVGARGAVSLSTRTESR